MPFSKLKPETKLTSDQEGEISHSSLYGTPSQSESNAATENAEGKETAQNEDSNAELNQQIQSLSEKNQAITSALATAINEKNRAIRQAEERVGYAISDFSEKLTEIVEIFFLAQDAVKPEDLTTNQPFKSFFDGIMMTRQQILDLFQSNGIERIYPSGQAFDHKWHQAVSRITSEQPENTVIQVLKAGYVIKGRLLKPALVIVSAGKN